MKTSIPTQAKYEAREATSHDGVERETLICVAADSRISTDSRVIAGAARTARQPIKSIPRNWESSMLFYDEPGRCGGMDSHCHHYRVVGHQFLTLLVRNGSGDHRLRLSHIKNFIDLLASLDSNSRYWLLNTIYHTHADAISTTSEKVNTAWRKAAAEKRIKTRKMPGQGRRRLSNQN